MAGLSQTPKLTELMVRGRSSPESFERGLDYYDRGAVLNVARRGDRVLAQVEGSEYDPYRVTIKLDAAGITSTTCSCPYEFGGACKHIVAVLLTIVRKPEEVEERSTLAELLADLSAEDLRTLLLALAERLPDLTDSIESQVALLRVAPAPALSELGSSPTLPRTRQAPLDPALFQRQVRAALNPRNYNDGWPSGSSPEAVRQIASQAEPYLEAGDGRNAMVILQAVTEEYVEHWMELDDSDGDMGDYFSELGELWAEAILTADLTAAERKSWAKKFAKWQAEVEDYGIDEAFDAAGAAAEQGWDYEPLKRALLGEAGEKGAWQGEAPWFADTLALARLRVLERQGRTQEYLNLAEAEGQYDLHVTMLVKLGRVQEAIDYGLSYFVTPQEAFSVAKMLRESDEMEGAIRTAEHGLNLEGSKVELARWLRDLLSGVGQRSKALWAAQIAMSEHPSLENYLAVETLAGEEWPALREELLASLREPGKAWTHGRAQVEIFVHEGLVEDAIASVEANQYLGHGLLEMVVEAAAETRPEWVIKKCSQEAEAIIESGKSKYYSSAARWLERARPAYAAQGREREWRALVEDAIARNKRKHSLTPLLQELLKRK